MPLTERWKDTKSKYNCLWKILKSNGLLSCREKDEKCLKEYIEKWLTTCEKRFFEPIKRSGIQITIESKKYEKKHLNWRKIDRL